MKVAPYMICPHIPNDARLEYECSDRILVAENVFTQYRMGFWPSRCIHIKNQNEESIAGYIYNIHPEHDTIYIPSWMYRLFSSYTDICVSELRFVECDYIEFEPISDELIKTENYKEQLIETVSKYVLLIPNSQITILFNNSIYPIRIVKLTPSSDCVAYKLKKNGVCNVVFNKPTVQTVSNTDVPDIPFLVYPKKPIQRVLPFSGRGYLLGGPQPPKKHTPAQMSYAAALKRRS